MCAKRDVDWFGRITSVATLLVSILGLFAVVVSYRSLKEAEASAQLASTNARLSAYQQMVLQSANVEKVIIEHSAMRPYFRDGKPLKPGDEDYNLAASIAELRLDAFDALLTFPAMMGFDREIGGWRNTVRDAFKDSPVMCKVFADHKDNYGSATVGALANEGCR